MDGEGLRRRKSRPIPADRLLQALAQRPGAERRRFLDPDAPEDAPRLRRDLSREERDELQQLVFDRLPYAEKLEYCHRPEQIDGPSLEAWAEINAHLGTEVFSLPELIEELGRRRFGHRPRVGDAFCGGGSIPFEAARLGCDAYGSDLNPVAALLTWAALNIVGGGEEVAQAVQKAQQTSTMPWIARSPNGASSTTAWAGAPMRTCTVSRSLTPSRAGASPSRPRGSLARRHDTIARLVPDPANKRYDDRNPFWTSLTQSWLQPARARCRTPA